MHLAFPRVSHWECVTTRVAQWLVVNGEMANRVVRYLNHARVVHYLKHAWWWRWHVAPRVSRVSLKEFGCPFGCDHGVNKNSHRQWQCHVINLTPPLFFSIQGLAFKGRQRSLFLFCDFCCGVLALLSTIVYAPHSVHTHHMYTLYTYIHVQNKEINAHITKYSRRLRPEGLYSYGETLGGVLRKWSLLKF